MRRRLFARCTSEFGQLQVEHGTGNCERCVPELGTLCIGEFRERFIQRPWRWHRSHWLSALPNRRQAQALVIKLHGLIQVPYGMNNRSHPNGRSRSVGCTRAQDSACRANHQRSTSKSLHSIFSLPPRGDQLIVSALAALRKEDLEANWLAEYLLKPSSPLEDRLV